MRKNAAKFKVKNFVSMGKYFFWGGGIVPTTMGARTAHPGCNYFWEQSSWVQHFGVHLQV